MSSPHTFPDSFRLDAYLDGELPREERDAMSREIDASRELQAEAELQTQIDESLRKCFAPPAPPAELLSKVREFAPARRVAHLRPRRWRTLVAVATAATVVWGMVAWQFFGGKSQEPDYNPNQPLDSIYATCVAEGFRPAWVCKDDREFASVFRMRQGQGLLLGAMPAGSKMEGLTYCGGLSRYTTTMLARVHGSPVMVFVDRADADSHPASPCASSQLQLFRKELGPLVLYELTPLDRPSVMDFLYLADVSEVTMPNSVPTPNARR
jgi:hypothetical protein